MGDPGDEQVILEGNKPVLYCGGCVVAMVKTSEGFECPNCKSTVKA